MSVPRVGLSVWCALALVVACSSTRDPSNADGGDNADANDAASFDASSCLNCGITDHVLTREAAPDDCTFTIGLSPPDIFNVKVRAGTTTIPPSDTDGWVYQPGPMAITLTGSYCVSARNGTITSLTMLFGCPSCPIP